MSRPRVPSYYAFSAPRVSARVSCARASAKSFSRGDEAQCQNRAASRHVADPGHNNEQAHAEAADVKAEAELLGPAAGRRLVADSSVRLDGPSRGGGSRRRLLVSTDIDRSIGLSRPQFLRTGFYKSALGSSV